MILFRSDSSYEIGTGHIVRCLRLAKIFRALGKQVKFLSRDLPGNVLTLIKQESFDLLTLHPTESDLEEIKKLRPKWLIVDHYGLDIQWEKQASQFAKIFVIDDLLRPHECDILLDQNFRESYDGYKHLVPARCRTLIGPQFCLLDEGLKPKNLSDSLLRNPSPLQKILVFFGGADSRNDIANFHKSVAVSSRLSHLHFELVVLASHRHIESIRQLPPISHIKIHFQPQNWFSLLKSADFYIGSGGTVTWERLFVGVPGAVISVADNQVAVSREMAKHGLQYYWGDSEGFDWNQLEEKIEDALSTPSDLLQMSIQGQALVRRVDAQLIQSLATDF